MPPSIDKRKFNRIRTTNFEIEFKIGGSGVTSRVKLINISAGGLCFLRTSIINKDDTLLIKFPFTSKKIILPGKVTRIEGREVAIEFTGTEEEIEAYVDTFNREYPSLRTAGSREAERMLTADKIELQQNEDVYDIDRILDLKE